MKILLFQKKSLLIIITATIIGLSLFLVYCPIQADDENSEDDGIGLIGEDLAKDIGPIAIALFGAGMLNVFVLYIYKLSRRFLKEEGISGKIKNFTRETHLKSRKPLNYLHYLLTLSATTIIILHGIEFMRKDDEVGIFGWISVGIFLLYIISGLIIKLKLKPFWTSRTTKNVLNKLHRSLLIFFVVIIIHAVHITLAD